MLLSRICDFTIFLVYTDMTNFSHFQVTQFQLFRRLMISVISSCRKFFKSIKNALGL